MAPIGRHNIAKMLSTTTGTGTLTLTTAAQGYNTFADAGVQNAEIVTYTIRDGAHTEVGRGTYTTAGTTLSRDEVLSSTNGGAKISCTGRQFVMITLASEDISPFGVYTGSSGTILDGVDDTNINLATEVSDPCDIGSVSGNAVTIAKRGRYLCSVNVNVDAATAFNGYIKVDFDGFYKSEGYTTAMGITTDTIFVGPFQYYMPSDGGTMGPVTISNHAGVSVDYYINDLTIVKLGNTT